MAAGSFSMPIDPSAPEDSSRAASVSAVASGAHDDDDLLHFGGPAGVAGDRRRPARWSNSSDMTPLGLIKRIRGSGEIPAGPRHGDASSATAPAPMTKCKRSEPGHAAIALPGFVQAQLPLGVRPARSRGTAARRRRSRASWPCMRPGGGKLGLSSRSRISPAATKYFSPRSSYRLDPQLLQKLRGANSLS